MPTISHSHDGIPLSGLERAERPQRGLMALLASLGAAVRVAQAIESRRDPDPADLRELGIDGPVPRLYY